MHIYNFLCGEPCRFDPKDGRHRGRLFQEVMGKEKMKVFKAKAKTGLTTGLLRTILLDMQKARKDLLSDITNIMGRWTRTASWTPPA
jgi:hypothetical protein